MADDDVYSENTDDEEEFKAETFLYLKKHHHYKDPCYALVVAESAGCLTELFESEETAYLAEYDSLSKQISKQIEINDKDQFASFIVQNYYKLKAFPASEVLARLCKKCATACVTAFLDSQLHIYVDLNEKYKGISTPCLPLEHAAGGLSYSLTHLLLCRGAIAKDVVLEKALFAFRYHDYVIGWISRQQTYFKLIELLGSPELEEPLNVIKLLASHIEQPKIFNLCLSYIELGDIIKLGALLFVSWDRLLVPSPDLENTPIVQFILRELAPQLELYMNDEENFVNAFNVIGILRHQRMLKHEAPRDITYAGPWGVSSDIANCLLLKLTYESEVLSRKIFSKKQMLSGSTSRSYVGVQKPAFGSGFQFSLQMSVPPTHTSPNRLAIYHDIVNQKSNTTLMKSSSRNVFTLARAHAPLLRIVKRIIK